MLTETVIPFLQDPDSVVDPQDVYLLHKAPCFKALATQELLRESGIDFFSSAEYPSNSPDLNVTENIGAITNIELKKKCSENIVMTDFHLRH